MNLTFGMETSEELQDSWKVITKVHRFNSRLKIPSRTATGWKTSAGG
jgi:hypothetical protein